MDNTQKDVAVDREAEANSTALFRLLGINHSIDGREFSQAIIKAGKEYRARNPHLTEIEALGLFVMMGVGSLASIVVGMSGGHANKMADYGCAYAEALQTQFVEAVTRLFREKFPDATKAVSREIEAGIRAGKSLGEAIHDVDEGLKKEQAQPN